VIRWEGEESVERQGRPKKRTTISRLSGFRHLKEKRRRRLISGRQSLSALEWITNRQTSTATMVWKRITQRLRKPEGWRGGEREGNTHRDLGFEEGGQGRDEGVKGSQPRDIGYSRSNPGKDSSGQWGKKKFHL